MLYAFEVNKPGVLSEFFFGIFFILRILGSKDLIELKPSVELGLS